MSSSLTCQSRAATASSYESFEERFGFRSWKYVPVTVSTSGSEDRSAGDPPTGDSHADGNRNVDADGLR